MSTRLAQVYQGTILTPVGSSRSVEILVDQVLAVDGQGQIVHLAPASAPESQEILAAAGENVVRLGKKAWLMPGFVDTHIHAPQLPNAGVALDKPLMEWLEHYTFKAESRVDADPEGYGARVYKRLVERLVENGTTLASVFGTLSVEANLVLAKSFQEGGIRGHIGKVNMDLNGIPSYIETTSQSLSRTRDFLAQLATYTSTFPLHQRLVQPVLTPRFVPTCSGELMRGLGNLAREHGVRVQSHGCESSDMVAWSEGMWGGKGDVQVLEEHGLLGSNALLAHCTHLTPAQSALLASTGTGIAHCPLSNAYFSPTRMLPLLPLLSSYPTLNIGLGTDISGGYDASMMSSMRWAVGTSRMETGLRATLDQADISPVLNSEGLKELEKRRNGAERGLSWKESLHLATLGGARAMGMQGVTGSLEVGKAFDAQLIDLSDSPNIDFFEEEEAVELMVERWWCNGGREERKGVWVQGARLK